jgi:hypothetical protein
MTSGQRFSNIILKVERAKKHVRALEGEVKVFLEREPYKVGVTLEQQSRRPAYYLAAVEAVPDTLALIAGDAIQNLRSALDHLAFQIVRFDTGADPINPKDIYFPISETNAQYSKSLSKKLRGASRESIDKIDAFKPYEGGNDQLCMLHYLNIIEKHRTLLAVGCLSTGFAFPDFMVAKSEQEFIYSATEYYDTMNVFLEEFGGPKFPLEAGLPLFVDRADSELNPNLKFRFDIAFNEAGVAQGNPIVETLHQLTDLVEGIVAAFEPKLG